MTLNVILDSEEYWERGSEVQAWQRSRSTVVGSSTQRDIHLSLRTVSIGKTYIYRYLRPHFIAYRPRFTYAIHTANTAATTTPRVLATLTQACLNCGTRMSATRFVKAGGALPLGKGLSGTGLSKKVHRGSLCNNQPRLALK